MKTFITADTHFGDEAIIKYTNRPFTNAKQMDDTLITNWNASISEDDIVWHLGDFAYGDNREDIARYAKLVCIACSLIPYGEPSKSLATRIGDGLSTMFKDIGRSMDRTFN